MSWKDDVEALLPRLPPQFRIDDVYRFVPFLHAKHPENFHVEEKIRQVLQQLRDEGKLTFVGEGNYQQRTVGDGIVSDLPIVPNALTTRIELARMLGQAGDTAAALRRGMFKPAKGPFRNHMFLFHNETENPYGDAHEGSTVRYVGQGMKGNQELKSYNATLARHLDEGVQVHYFVQPREHPGQVRYVGPVFVESFEEVYRPAEERTVWEFVLQPVEGDRDPVGTYGTMLRSMLEYDRPAGPIERPLVERKSRIRLRDRAFRELVVPAYKTKCAVCRDPLTKGKRLSELEAAHIRSVQSDGPDELRNGISLCGRHHWSFDNGLFTISDGLQVLWLSPHTDPHKEMRDGMDLFVPVDDDHKPHKSYLAWHRERSGALARAFD
ncbi:MAG TPA: HNH endonuclease [Candidatus Thermoplasmatota archaeon]|nr:HNH endonuclease [Candidatus Thermoplasmatota archaeon]